MVVILLHTWSTHGKTHHRHITYPVRKASAPFWSCSHHSVNVYPGLLLPNYIFLSRLLSLPGLEVEDRFTWRTTTLPQLWPSRPTMYFSPKRLDFFFSVLKWSVPQKCESERSFGPICPNFPCLYLFDTVVQYSQPVFQTACGHLGEYLCLPLMAKAWAGTDIWRISGYSSFQFSSVK